MTYAAIFDVDGTILDTLPLWGTSAGSYLSSLGIEVDPDLGKAFFSMTLPESARAIRERYNLEHTEDEIMRGVVQAVASAYRDSVPMKANVPEFLGVLREAGVPMAVVSSGSESLIRPAFERLGIAHFFSYSFASSETGVSKREPQMFVQAAEALGASPSQTWVFDDALYALRTAKEAGFHVVAMADAHSLGEAPQLRALASDYWDRFPVSIPAGFFGH